MTMTVGELYSRVRSSFDDDVEMTAGKEAAWRPALRVSVVGDRPSAQKVQKYDAVIFYAAHRRRCSTLDVAELISEKGAGVFIICRDEHGQYELEQLRLLSDRLSLPLMEIASAECLPSLINLIYEETIAYYEPVIGISKLMQGIIRMPELYRYYGALLSRYGFSEFSEYCVAVCQLVGRDGFTTACSGTAWIPRFIEAGLSTKEYASAVLSMGYQVAVVFADADAEKAAVALQTGLDAIPESLSGEFHIYVGVSDTARGIDSLPSLFGFAARTALLHMRRGDNSLPVGYSERQLNRFMITMKDREAADALARNALKGLAEYDRQNETEYVELLRVYFRNNCSIQKTANELYIHRNSVNYALRKIESILGSSLSDIYTKVWLVLVLGFSELSGDDYPYTGRRSGGGTERKRTR